MNNIPFSPVQSFINMHVEQISTVTVSNSVITIKFNNSAEFENQLEKLDELKPSVKSVAHFKDDNDIFTVEFTMENAQSEN